MAKVGERVCLPGHVVKSCCCCFSVPDREVATVGAETEVCWWGAGLVLPVAYMVVCMVEA